MCLPQPSHHVSSTLLFFFLLLFKPSAFHLADPGFLKWSGFNACPFCLFEWFLHKSLPFNPSRPNTWARISRDSPMSWSTTRTWTSHPSHTWSRTWSPTAFTLSGSPVTAARARLTGHPGLNCAPKKEVSLLSEDMFVFSKCGITPSEVGHV